MSWEFLTLLFLDSTCIYTFDENSMHTKKKEIDIKKLKCTSLFTF
jgi:hypothetical protein